MLAKASKAVPVRSYSHIRTDIVGVAPITQYTHVRKKKSNTQGSSPYVVKVIFNTLRNCSKRKEFAPSGRKFFPLREVPMKRDTIENKGTQLIIIA